MSSGKEVTIKDIYFKLKDWFSYLLSKWIWIVAAGIICGIIGIIYAWVEKPKYTAELTFILSNNSSSTSTLYGLASEFGIDLSSSSDVFSDNNIVSLMTSQTMVQKALLQKPPNTNETLLNMYVKDEQLDEGWNKKDHTKGSYPFPNDTSKMNYVQDSLFRDVYKKIEDSYLSVVRPDKDLSIYKVITTSEDEIFSLYLTKYLVEATSKFYIDTKTSVARNNLNMIQHEADSIHDLLNGSIASTAHVYDYTYNLNPALQAQRIPAQEAQLNATALGNAYGEVLKDLEIAKISLQKETPLYQIVDAPEFPLIADKTGRLIGLIVGGFAGGFLMVLFLILKKLLSESLSKSSD